MNKYFFIIIRTMFAIVFIFAGIEKIADPGSFSDVVANYKLFPYFSINFIAILIPWLELITGILLFFGTAEKENIVIQCLLLSVFTVIIFISVLRGLNIDCGCFGTIKGSEIGIMKIIENITLLLAGCYLFYFADKFNEARI